MFQDTRSGDAALFGHMTDEKDRNPTFFGKVLEGPCTVPDLGDAAGCGLKGFTVGSLN
jgi:hypothetical protein